MQELKSCPFCGNIKNVRVLDSNQIEGIDKDNPNYSHCAFFAGVCSFNNPNPNSMTKGGCGASSGYASTIEEATKKWNTRHDKRNVLSD